jgi:hypothetical protein
MEDLRLKTTVLIVGIVIVLVGLIGASRPIVLRTLVRSFRSTAMLYVAAVIRISLGIVLLLAAPGCRFTIAVYVLGVITLLSGLLLPVIGKVRFVALIDWWLRLSDGAVRAWVFLAIVYGVFLAVAAF